MIRRSHASRPRFAGLVAALALRRRAPASPASQVPAARRDLQPGDPLPALTPTRVLRVPSRPRRLHRSRNRRRRARARRSTARAARSATTCRRSAAAASSSRCAPATATPTARSRGAERRGRHADAPVLDADARLPAADSRRRERGRAARADSAVRRRPGRGDSRRDAARARRSARSQSATASAAAPRSSSIWRRGERRVGRFGWKAQHATLLAFGADAYRNEMGITNDSLPARSRPSASTDAQMRRCDPIPDPEDASRSARRGAAASTTSSRSCGSSRRSRASRSTRPRATASAMFSAIGCATLSRAGADAPGRAPIRCSIARPVPLFSDLLLHDIGTGDGIAQGAADAARDPHAGALGAAAAPAAAARRQRRRRSRTPSAGTATKRELARRGFDAPRRRRNARQLLAFLRSL